MRAPMAEVLDTLNERLALLSRYEARYGPLTDDNAPPPVAQAASAPHRPAIPPSPPLAPARLSQPQPQQQNLSGLEVVLHEPRDDDDVDVDGEGSGSGVDTPESAPY